MKTLNNKGMTTVEILVTFVLVVIITVSMYSTVASYKEKQQIESYKEKIFTYKNLLTRDIQDDLIKRRLVVATVTETTPANYSYVTQVDFLFADASKSRLVIKRELARDYDYQESVDGSGWPKRDDKFVIEYGPLTGTNDFSQKQVYEIPNLGYGENADGNKVSDLRIQNVKVSTKGGVFSLNLDFYHVELLNQYGINIVCPIDF